MPQFSFSARTVDGMRERGVIEAVSEDDARERLRKKTLVAEELTLVRRPAPPTAKPQPAVPTTPSLLAPAVAEPQYAPLTDTVRLFAGWLLAWYGIVYLLGSYQREYALPYELGFVDNMFTSTLVLRFAFGTFLFLFLSTLFRWMNGGFVKGFFLWVLWGLGVAFFVVNT